ncbi:hypothetical protein TNCV_2561231 [Trichonephila clavipes]|uniref:Uncharacterized protein n=1 Tax=Trichonephila clavipes TaxID=2585209 RepID=A0A8X6R6K7_TRICX|nr:hypothetical protein TNCV_2561231 [Trichonephila clavipes]
MYLECPQTRFYHFGSYDLVEPERAALIIEKESVPVLTCSSSQKFSASSEPPRSVFTIPLTDLSRIPISRVICLVETLGSLWTRFSMVLRLLEVFTVRVHPLPDIDHHCKLFETADYIRHCLPRYIKQTNVSLAETTLK